MNQLSERYLEDFAVGQTFGSGRLRIDGERALAFAAEFDPQPFHLEEAAARRSIFWRTDRQRVAHRCRDDAAAD
jgi:acyl dehydratase